MDEKKTDAASSSFGNDWTNGFRALFAVALVTIGEGGIFMVAHQLRESEQLKRDYPGSPYLFVTERGGPMPGRMRVRRAGDAAGIACVHPHRFRPACGYTLPNDGTDTRKPYLGHRNIQHTTRYTALASDRFNSFWKD